MRCLWEICRNSSFWCLPGSLQKITWLAFGIILRKIPNLPNLEVCHFPNLETCVWLQNIAFLVYVFWGKFLPQIAAHEKLLSYFMSAGTRTGTGTSTGRTIIKQVQAKAQTWHINLHGHRHRYMKRHRSLGQAHVKYRYRHSCKGQLWENEENQIYLKKMQ